MTSALTGMTTDPVIRKSSSRVASTTTTAAIGSRDPSLDLTSASSAAGPPTCMSKAGAVGADPLDQRGRGWALGRAGRDEVDDGRAGGGARPDGGAGDAVRVRDVGHPCCGGRVAGSTSAMTVTGSVPRAGNRSASTSAVARASDDRGRLRASPVSNRALRNGVPSITRTAATAAAKAIGRPCTSRASR